MRLKRATLATSAEFPVVACKWNVRMVLIANVDAVVKGVKNPLRTYPESEKPSE